MFLAVELQNIFVTLTPKTYLVLAGSKRHASRAFVQGRVQGRP